MKRFLLAASASLLPVAAALLLLASPAWAAPKTVTLAVPGMTCATCPITVKKALTKVTGVTKVDVDLDQLQAVVTFDDATLRSFAEISKDVVAEAGGRPSLLPIAPAAGVWLSEILRIRSINRLPASGGSPASEAPGSQAASRRREAPAGAT